MTISLVNWLAFSPRLWKVVGSIPDRVTPNTLKLVFAASFRNKTNIGQPCFGIMCLVNRALYRLTIVKAYDDNHDDIP